jgi:hypothetical protein
MDPADHLSRPWRVHALAAADGALLHDVWQVDAALSSRATLDRWIEAFRAERHGLASRGLFAIRLLLGRVLRLDRADSRFEPVYREPEEQLLRIDNRTVTAYLHVSLADRRPRLAVYVRTKGRLGEAYMRLIDPFRRHIVYPGLVAAGRRAVVRVNAAYDRDAA